MSKSYLLVNKQPGSRGVQTALGVVMVHPSPAGASNGVVAVLTDDELDMAKAVGLEATEHSGDAITGLQSSNLPAEGQVDPNSPDGAEMLNDAREKAEKAAAHALKAGNGAAGATAKPAPVPTAGGAPAATGNK